MPTRPPGTPDVDLTFDGASGTINGGIFQTPEVQPAGTGTFNTFVRIQHTGTEQGYNSDAAPQFDEKASFDHSILLANIPIVIGDGIGGTNEGTAYREFRLDMNETTPGSFISLDALQVWQEESGSLTNFTPGSGFAGSHTNLLVYNLDAGSNHWVGLNDSLSHGSGQSDIRILIPDSEFINDAAHRYVTVYSQFGVQAGWSTDGGFEEWGINNDHTGPTAAMAVHKTAFVDGVPNGPGVAADAAGDVITYAISVDNVGDTTLTGISVTDLDPFVTNLTLVSGDTNTNGLLDAGETWQYTASYTVTQNDIDTLGGGDGFIENTVTADSAQTAPLSASAFVVVESGAEVTVTKTADVSSVNAAGNVIHYAIDLENTGNASLNDVTVIDSQVNNSTPILDFTAPVLGPELLVGVLNGDYNIGDLNQNGIQDPDDPLTPAYDPETFVFVNQGDYNQNGVIEPELGEMTVLTNVGDTNQSGVQDPGEDWLYYNAGDTNHNGVPNDGETFQFNVSHDATPVDADEDGFNDGDMNHDGQINVGEIWHYTVGYTVTQDDIDNGGVYNPSLTHDNTATVDTAQTGTTTATSHVPIHQNPSIDLTKTATVTGGTADVAGDVISYTITLHNTGNMTLTGVVVSDPPGNPLTLVSGDTDNDSKLDLTETWTYSASHTLTQAEIDNGGVVNPALAYSNTATVTTGQAPATDTQTVNVPIVQDPRVTLAKSATVADGTADAVGDVINYTIDVHNAGNMTLTGVSVSDPSVSDLTRIADLVGNNDNILNLGETWRYTAKHSVTQADIDNGGVVDPALQYTNTASVTTAQSQQVTNGDPDASASASASVHIVQNPNFTVAKLADVASVDAAGDVINYTVTVKNTGNMTLTGVAVSDPLVTNLLYASGDTNSDGKLDLSETWTYTGSHAVTQPEMDAGGTINNAATADTVQTAPKTASASVTVQQHPAVTLDKAGTFVDDNNDGYAEVGEHINYTFAITNTGNVTLHNVSVSDADAGVSVSGSAIAALGPGSSNSATWTASYAITQTDIDNGSFANTATATATGGTSATDTATVTLPPAPPPTSGISIDDNGNASQLVLGPPAHVGDLIQFFFQITNLGNTTLTSVAVSDTLGDIATPGNLQGPVPSTLAGNAVFTDTFNHHITAADLSAHHVIDNITVAALDYLNVTQTSMWHYDFVI